MEESAEVRAFVCEEVDQRTRALPTRKTADTPPPVGQTEIAPAQVTRQHSNAGANHECSTVQKRMPLNLCAAVLTSPPQFSSQLLAHTHPVSRPQPAEGLPVLLGGFHSPTSLATQPTVLDCSMHPQLSSSPCGLLQFANVSAVPAGHSPIPMANQPTVLDCTMHPQLSSAPCGLLQCASSTAVPAGSPWQCSECGRGVLQAGEGPGSMMEIQNVPANCTVQSLRDALSHTGLCLQCDVGQVWMSARGQALVQIHTDVAVQWCAQLQTFYVPSPDGGFTLLSFNVNGSHQGSAGAPPAAEAHYQQRAEFELTQQLCYDTGKVTPTVVFDNMMRAGLTR